jgi:hypothetical protein
MQIIKETDGPLVERIQVSFSCRMGGSWVTTRIRGRVVWEMKEARVGTLETVGVSAGVKWKSAKTPCPRANLAISFPRENKKDDLVLWLERGGRII